jgi:anti-sigma B factor antagonist
MSDLSEGLRLFITNPGSRARLDVGGELDLATVGAFRQHLELLVEAATGDVDVDMALVTFCDATMLGALVTAYHRLTPVDRDLHVINASPPVVRLLELTALDAMLLRSTEDADACLDGGPRSRRATLMPSRNGACARKESPDAHRQARQRHRR